MRKKVITGILILTISSLIIKFLGFVFRIFLSNKIGAEGMGLYQLIISVYALGAAISTSGISTAVSKLVAINQKNSEKILKSAFLLTGTIGFVALFYTFINAENISLFLLKDERVIIPVKIVALSFPIISIFACLSGYFYGQTEVKYPIKGQIIEQLTRITFIFFLIEFALKGGIIKALIITSSGIVLGELFSMLYLFFEYKYGFKNRMLNINKKSYIFKLLAICIPISINSYTASFLHTVENIIIPIRFTMFGFTHREAISMLGIIKGMVMPLIFFPTAVLSSVATVALPTISYAKANNRANRINHCVNYIFKLTLIIIILFVSLFLFFGDKITYALYKTNEAAAPMRLMALQIPMIYLNIVIISILNGLGNELRVMINGITEGFLRIVFIYFAVPLFGLNGYALSLVISAFFGCGLNLFILLKNCDFKFNFLKLIINPAFSCVLSFFLTYPLNNIYAVFILFPILYLLLLILLKTIEFKDLLWIKHNIFKF